MTVVRAATSRERFEGYALSAFLGLFGLLPTDAASALGGAFARFVGPLLSVSRRARRNLMLALPDRAVEHDRIIAEMWDNFGRVMAEYAHIAKLRVSGQHARIEVVGLEHIVAVRDSGRASLVFSGHIGNWEVGCIAAANLGFDVTQVYRAANNPMVEAKMVAFRTSLGVQPVPKGASGARLMIAAIKARRTLAMLIDQKMNDGIAVPFFGRDAMTAPAMAELAMRYDVALLPCRVERIKGVRFRVTVCPPLILPKTGDARDDVRTVMVHANAILEQWIREKPGQWFWLHRRWPGS